MKTHLLLVSCILFILSTVDGQLQVKGRGATLPAPVYSELIFAYSLVKPEVKIEYLATGSGDGRTSIANPNPAVDFAGSDTGVPETLFAQFPNLKMFPALAAAITPVYNIANLTRTEKLFLTRKAVVDIFAGRITSWRDPEIINNNPTIASKIPDANITVVVRADDSGTSGIFTGSLNAIAQTTTTTWPYGTISRWPTTLTSLPNWKKSLGNQGVQSSVVNTPNSIGYVALPAFSNGESYPGVNVALLMNRHGQIVDPENNTYTQNAQATAKFNNRFYADIQDPAEADTWPISGYTYLIFQDQFNDKCVERREMFKFFNWLVTSDGARARTASLGYSPLPQQVATKVIAMLKEIKCKEDKLLSVDVIPQHTSAVFPTLTAIGATLIVLIGVQMFRVHKPSKMSTIYTMLIAVSAVIALLGAIFFALVPSDSSSCLLRQWLTSIGVIALLSFVIASRWELFQKQKNESKGADLPVAVALATDPANTLTRRERWANRALWLALGSIGVQILHLIIWSGVDGYQARQVIVDPIDLLAEWECHSDYLGVWFGIVMAHIGFLLVAGMFVNLDLKNVGSRARHEVRWLWINIYNLLLLLAVLLPIILSTEGKTRDDDDWHLLFVLLIFILSNVIVVMAPSAIRKSKRANRRKMIVELLENPDAATNNDDKVKKLLKGRAVTLAKPGAPVKMNSSGSVLPIEQDR